MRHYFIYILALTACLTIAGCSDDDELTPSYADQNRFLATDSATNPVSAMRNEFYRETGSYLLFNDTLRHEAIGTDAEGNTYDFCFGLNWKGVIDDERTKTYKAAPLTKPEKEEVKADA